MASIIAGKLTQAVRLLDDLGLDCWLTFVRETTEAGDPVLPLILGQPLTWPSALIVTRGGERLALVGKYEDEAVRSTGAWSEVVAYVQGVAEPLRETLARLDPKQIAINHSLNDVKADGLSYGMYQVLRQHLDGTPYANRLVSAERLIGALRGRKTTEELQRIRGAIATTEELFTLVGAYARPGRSEHEISAFLHEQLRRRGLEPAWERAMCPIVTTGSASMVGHGLPSPELRITEGQIFHIDFGVRQDAYCSDLQRCWYVPADGETEPPAPVRHAFDTVARAIRAAADAAGPGVEGWRVDEAARQVVVEAGYPEYEHATGHHVGRAAHDGAGVLGPRWERYGRTPFYPLEPGNVVTLELGVHDVDGRGYLGLEEMVLVTDDGCTWLSAPQTELPLLTW